MVGGQGSSWRCEQTSRLAEKGLLLNPVLSSGCSAGHATPSSYGNGTDGTPGLTYWDAVVSFPSISSLHPDYIPQHLPGAGLLFVPRIPRVNEGFVGWIWRLGAGCLKS